MQGEDHLHIRGEHMKRVAQSYMMVGSSPHTWRTHGSWSAPQGQDRIISTYVENTHTEDDVTAGIKDHLHIRGEHDSVLIGNSQDGGSSPHTWRTQC